MEKDFPKVTLWLTEPGTLNWVHPLLPSQSCSFPAPLLQTHNTSPWYQE